MRKEEKRKVCRCEYLRLNDKFGGVSRNLVVNFLWDV